MNNHDYISVNKFAKMANVTTVSVYNWIKKGLDDGSNKVVFDNKKYTICVIADKYCLQEVK